MGIHLCFTEKQLKWIASTLRNRSEVRTVFHTSKFEWIQIFFVGYITEKSRGKSRRSSRGEVPIVTISLSIGDRTPFFIPIEEAPYEKATTPFTEWFLVIM